MLLTRGHFITGGMMYISYVEAFGRDIIESLGTELQSCEFVSDCHSDFGYDSSIMIKRMKNSNIHAVFTTDIDFNYVSDYKVTKYFTKDGNGTLKFWSYDFNRFFPTMARPSVIIIARDETALCHIQSLITDEYTRSHSIEVAHPILPDHWVPFKLMISNKEHMKHYHDQDEGVYTTVIYFDIVNLPWYFREWNKADIYSSQSLQKEALRQYFVLCDLEENCFAFIQHSEENSETDAYRLNTIKTKKTALLDAMGIGNDMRDFEAIKRISKIVNIQGSTIQEAMDQIYSEIIERRKREIERLNAEKERVQARYYDYRPQGEPVLKSVFESLSEHRKEKKFERKLEGERQKYEREQWQRDQEERHRRAVQSQREWDAVKKANEERRRKGQPELPLPPRFWY